MALSDTPTSGAAAVWFFSCRGGQRGAMEGEDERGETFAWKAFIQPDRNVWT